MRKVKVWGGEHPDELAALACVDSLVADPIANVSPGVANPRARELGKRFVDTNMAYAFPGDPNSPNYEELRAVEVVRESQGFDFVATLHNADPFCMDVAWIDAKRGVCPVVLGFLAALGMRSLVLTDYGGMQGHISNAFLMETDPNGLGGDIEKLRAAFDALANDPNPPEATVSDFTWFNHLDPGAHVDNFDPRKLTAHDHEKLRNFEPLPDAIASRMGFGDIPVHMLSWSPTPNNQGFWGEAATPVLVPDDSLWPKRADEFAFSTTGL